MKPVKESHVLTCKCFITPLIRHFIYSFLILVLFMAGVVVPSGSIQTFLSPARFRLLRLISGSPKTTVRQSLQKVLGLPWGLHPLGCLWYSSWGIWPEGIIVSDLNHFSWLRSIHKSSRSPQFISDVIDSKSSNPAEETHFCTFILFLFIYFLSFLTSWHRIKA